MTINAGVRFESFGNARTAIKGSFGRYMAGQALGFPQRYPSATSERDPDLARPEWRQPRARQ
jgi:hypothetical protein